MLCILMCALLRSWLGSRVVSKTVAGAAWSRLKFDNFEENINGMVCAPTYKILSQSTLPKFFEISPDLRKFYKKSDSIIDVPGRGKIYCRSLDDPNSIEGMTLGWIWADEAGQMSHEAWINMQGRVSIKKGPIFITTTPYNMGWLYYDFYERWKQGDKDYKVVQFRSSDSPYFPKDEYERAKRTMDARIFRRAYDGQFERMEGLVYEDFSTGYITDNIPSSFDHVIAGIDWGFKAPTAICILGIKDNVFYLIDEYYGREKTQEEIRGVALNYKEQYGIKEWYPDTARPDAIEDFNRNGLHCLDVNKDIAWGVSKVSGIMREERLKVHPKCKNFLIEIEHYHYPEKQEGKETKEVPVGVDDHLMDALRYALSSVSNIERKPRRTIIDKRSIVTSRTGY